MKLKFIVCYCLVIFIVIVATCSFSIINDLPTPYKLETPPGFFEMPIPKENPLTVEGIALGRKLFYEPLLSANNKMSCGSCHQQKYAFSDTSSFSTGVDGVKGKRNALPIFNLGWTNEGFFWDGRAATLEAQAIEPMQNPIEMHETLENAVAELQCTSVYPHLFKKAFGSKTITVTMIANAIAQFERTIISSDSRYDKFTRKEPGGYLSPEEISGLNLFVDTDKGNCVGCHVLNGPLTSFMYIDIGLDSIAQDSGRYVMNPSLNEVGKFKIPSLRNTALTAPYMHDGRFQTLDQVLDHYSEGFKMSPNVNKLIFKNGKGRLSPSEKQYIIKFLKTLTDSSLIENPKFSNPN